MAAGQPYNHDESLPMPTDRVPLQPILSADSQSVIRQPTTAPAMRGSEPDGFNYICGVCNAMTVVESVVDGQLWDVVFRCFGCGGLCSTPHRPPGKAVPNKTLWLLLGETIDDPSSPESISLPKGIVIVGFAGRQSRPQPQPFNLATPDDLNQFIDRARSVMGPVFDDLQAVDRRGRAAKATPAKNPHRLMALVNDVQASAKKWRRTGEPHLRVGSTAELVYVVDLLERTRNYPALPDIVRSLENPTDFPHALVTLAALNVLLDLDNPIDLDIAKGPKRTADLSQVIDARRSAAIEVKTPKRLQGSGALDSMSKKDIRDLVEKQLHSAGTGSGGQLSPERDGLLVIGGFRLSDHEMDMLEDAAASVLAGKSRQHIIGIVFIAVNVMVSGTPAPGFDIRSIKASGVKFDNFGFNPCTSFRIVLNPTYTGDVRIEPPPGPPPVRYTEIVLPPPEEAL